MSRLTTPVPFKKGDPVRLTGRYAEALNTAVQAKRVDWRQRRGIVKACNATQVTIMWPGRRSPDYVQVKGVERIECTE